MVLDNGVCRVPNCMMHVGWRRATMTAKRDEQIQDDWASGLWTVEELSCFWGLKLPLILSIVREADPACARTPPLEVSHSR